MLRAPELTVTALASLSLVTACVPVQQLQSVAAAGGARANSMTGMGEQNTLTAVELRQLQTRDVGTTKAAAFASVMTVLLDSGYRVTAADLESGLITATSSTTGRLRLDPMGLSRADQTPVASAYVEDRDATSARVRIAFSVGTSATGQLAISGERAILKQDIYETFFSRLEEEIEQRRGARKPPRVELAAPSSAADPVSVAATPTADATSRSAEVKPDREEAPPQRGKDRSNKAHLQFFRACLLSLLGRTLKCPQEGFGPLAALPVAWPRSRKHAEQSVVPTPTPDNQSGR